MEKIYVFGHKKPDTDSITASISLSYLKNKLGMNTRPRCLGELNNETKFVLKYFHTPAPKYLNDVRVQIKDLHFLKNYSARKEDSILKGFHQMNENIIGTLPVVDEDNNFLGIASMKDIAKKSIGTDIYDLFTSYQNILDTLEAESILKFDQEIKGKLLIASYRSTTFIENIKIDPSTILIVGDRHSIIEYAVNNQAKMIILTGGAEIKEQHVELAKQNHINIVRTNHDTFTVSRLIGLANYLETILLTDNVVTFDEKQVISDFLETANKYKYSNYPILNANHKYLGIARMSDANIKSRKKVILVDHNEASQSADGLEEAEIIEIVDHHKIGTIGTSAPINFRNMPVGSSNTIIYQLYQEHSVEIPKEIAGLMMSGIISDTLLFRSPTTTKFDQEAVKKLAQIAEVDYQTYGMEMLKAGASFQGKTKEEIIYMDFKNFTIDEKKIGVGQVTTFNIEEIMREKEEYVALINQIAENNDYELVALFATDIIQNGSYMFYNKGAKDILDQAFGIEQIEEGYYLQDVVSRKKQIIPNIMNVLDNK